MDSALSGGFTQNVQHGEEEDAVRSITPRPVEPPEDVVTTPRIVVTKADGTHASVNGPPSAI